ncbi:MAG: type IV pili methyl-accepting chemotaxis transducer N-terminal domain-containing protein [Chromatiales bacterium]|nr:type IV pili methyl-accepting chemotaxis transducer N-terminal domain-containing protein [Chromatiales bacterium]
MAKLFKTSLLIRLGLAMATITTLAFLGMLSSVFIAETSEGQAAAINQAGSLRMQSYRIASALAHYTDNGESDRLARSSALITEFEQRLTNHRLTGVLAKSGDRELHSLYNRITMQWREQMQPLLQTYIEIASQHSLSTQNIELVDGLRTTYLAGVDQFVTDIDQLVKRLEMEMEEKIQLLRLIQIVSLFLTIFVVLVTMHLMNTNVLVPLRDLLGCASAVRHGDFSRRTRFHSEDELGQLAYTFNLMAEDLSRIYQNLEQRVREKTLSLEQRNQSLELLYRITQRLSNMPISLNTYEEILGDISTMLGTGPGSICLGEDGESQAFKLASTRPEVFDKPDLCNPPKCNRCFSDNAEQVIEIDRESLPSLRVSTFPIKDTEQQYGVLLIELPHDFTLEPWQQQLLETIAKHIAFALNITKRYSQERMLALLEERSVIARELHDSLAQSLSYLKIQVSRLDALIPQSDNGEKISSITTELRDGLNSAYRQLRELLTTFRLRMDEAGIHDALQKTVAEFNERGSIDIELDNRLGNCQLSPNAEIHVIQVVREALSNVLRHSQAEHAVVSLEFDAEGDVLVAIDDDGIGMPDETARQHHYGLTIMRERANGVSGALCILPSVLGGTRIELSFSAAGKWQCRDASHDKETKAE